MLIEFAELLNGRTEFEASEVPAEIWAGIAETLKTRWLEMEDGDDKRFLSDILAYIYAHRFRDTLLLPYLRERIAAVGSDGKLEEAIALFEACEKDTVLTLEDYRTLEEWYLAADRNGDFERVQADFQRAHSEGLKLLPEDQLSEIFHNSPGDLSEDALLALRLLLQKSEKPESYFEEVRIRYNSSHDFRLMQSLADAMTGRSPERVYSLLQDLETNVLSELRNEAAADEILASVKELRSKHLWAVAWDSAPGDNDLEPDAAVLAGKLTVTDLRALDLLEVVIERKSSELLNGSDPHVEACLAAMQRAVTGEWTEGEPRMMAAFLSRMKDVPNEKIRAEVLHALQALQKIARPASRDHLAITLHLCQLLFDDKTDAALQQMEQEVREYIETNRGVWPSADQQILGAYCTMLESAGQYAACEALLQSLLAQKDYPVQRTWLMDRLIGLYNTSLDEDGAVSIGTSRDEIFAAVVAIIFRELDLAYEEKTRVDLIKRLATTLDYGDVHHIAGTVRTAEKLVFDVIPVVLNRQNNLYDETIVIPLDFSATVLDRKLLLRYLVERTEQYPSQSEPRYPDYSGRYSERGYFTLEQLTRAREEADTTDFDDQILNIAGAELRQFLRTRKRMDRWIWVSGRNFWNEKPEEFRAIAEAVLNEPDPSGRHAISVAHFLRDSLNMTDRAIEILYAAHRRGMLYESEQQELANWLCDAHRDAEMIQILEGLVKSRPDSMYDRIELMKAWFKADHVEEMQTLIEQTEVHFRKDGLWTEGNMAQFARACQSFGRLDRAKRYFTEAIVLHQGVNPARGVNDVTLSHYYQQLASIESSLGNTNDAVTAIMSSIISIDAPYEHRTKAFNLLNRVMSDANDLDAIVAQLDAEAAQSGHDSPILRKAIGMTYGNRDETGKAIVQFKRALEFQPNDKETHLALIECYDVSDNPVAASAQLRQLIDLQPHDRTLYRQLAERTKDNAAEAERAATSIIESAPNEAESHAAMAEWRQSQDRWAEAIPHWQQVARYRNLEPTGLLKLAEAQIHENQFDAARQTLQTLNHTEWPSRFSDVESHVRQLEQQLANP